MRGFQSPLSQLALKNSSTAREILSLRRDIEALKESMKPPVRWIEVIVEPGQEAPRAPEGFHVIENHILVPAPPEPDVITPELQAITDEAERLRQLQTEEFASQRGSAT
jgi:hypothetical protein